MTDAQLAVLSDCLLEAGEEWLLLVLKNRKRLYGLLQDARKNRVACLCSNRDYASGGKVHYPECWVGPLQLAIGGKHEELSQVIEAQEEAIVEDKRRTVAKRNGSSGYCKRCFRWIPGSNVGGTNNYDLCDLCDKGLQNSDD